jgi:phosphoketolase
VGASLIAVLNQRINDAVAFAREHFEDPPEIRDWRWSE